MKQLADPTASKQTVTEAGLQLLSFLYAGTTTVTLNHLRYTMYMNMVATSSHPVKPEQLPPTVNAATYHILRNHLQIVHWATLMHTEKIPEDWGWRVNNGKYTPILTDLPVAPEDLLKVIKCGCSITSSRPCSTQICTCFKHGLTCVPACKNCCGDQCENIESQCTAEVSPNFSNSDEYDNNEDLEELIPEDCREFDFPWIDEEIIESAETLL